MGGYAWYKYWRSGEEYFCDYVDELQVGGKPENLKKVGHSTVYNRQIREWRRRSGGASDWGWRWRVQYSDCCISSKGRLVSHHLVIFCLLVLLLNLIILLFLSLSYHATFKSILKKKRGRKGKFIKPQKEKARHEDRIKRSKMIVWAKLVVGYWEFIPME